MEQQGTLVRHPAGSEASDVPTKKLQKLLREVEVQLGTSKWWSPAAAEAAMVRALAQGADAMDRGADGGCGLMSAAARLGLVKACQSMRETLKERRGGPAVERALIEMLMAAMEQRMPGGAQVTKETWDEGVDLRLLDSSGQSVLGVAVEFERWNLVATMIAAGADPCVGMNDRGNTPAHVAAQMSDGAGPRSLLSKALENKDNIDKPNAFGHTLLWCAVDAGQVWAVNELLKACADPRAVDHRGETPLSVAKKRKNVNFMQLLTVADERWEIAGAGWGTRTEESAPTTPRVRRRI